MEPLYAPRSVITDNFDNLLIEIPVRKNWFIILFLSFWLCGWFLGEVFALGAVFGVLRNAAGLFLVFWLCGWTVGGLFAFRSLLWMVAGKEVIKAGTGTLELSKPGLLFSKTRVYDLSQCKRFRIQDTGDGSSLWGFQRRSLPGFGASGIIRFDYGYNTIKFCDGVDEAEAKHLLDVLREKKILTDVNF